MPRASTRSRVLQELRECLQMAIVYDILQDSSSNESDIDPSEGGRELASESEVDDSESEGDEMWYVLAAAFGTAMSSRYLLGRWRIPRSVDFRYRYFLDLPADDFRCITRLSKRMFEYVVTLIQGDPIFHNQSLFQQAPVHWQVACALDRLGNDGQGVSTARSKMIWGLGHGTVLLYYWRVVHALFNIRNSFITWPNRSERQQISAQMEMVGFKGAVGLVDGTVFPLHCKPSLHGNNYMDRKKRYSINCQVVCDRRHQIRHVITGMLGNCHDSRIFSTSPLVNAPEHFFSPGQYLLADSAYRATPYLVLAYRSSSRDIPEDPMEPMLIERFNTHLAQARVVNEHTIGVLKSRWSSLRGLRILLRQEGDTLKVIRHVVACVILHNIALERDPWEEDLLPVDEDLIEDRLPARQHHSGRLNPGQRKHLEVRRQCLALFDGELEDSE